MIKQKVNFSLLQDIVKSLSKKHKSKKKQKKKKLEFLKKTLIYSLFGYILPAPI